MKEQDFNFLWLFNLLNKNIKTLFIILIVTCFLSAYVSLYVIKPKFKSSVVIYPTTTNSISQALLVEHNPYRKDVLEFGEEEAAEHLLQILNSDAIRDSIIHRFDLFTHYDIGLDADYPMTTIFKMYQDLIKFKKTKFNSIEIVVLDHSSEMAADIANEFLILLDVVINNIRKNRALQALEVLNKRKDLLYAKRNLIQDSLEYCRLNGVIGTTPQVERLTEQYAIALSLNNLSGASRIKKELDQLAKYAGLHDMLLRKSRNIEDELALVEFETERVEVDTYYSLENKFIINRAYPADKKASPVRWLIVFCSLISVLTLFIISIAFLDLVTISKDVQS
ncbi:MAG: hypothetical protein CMD27_00955 [Flavobacteriales bacterium]|nr:hypothetical protein [Flavobacteriales bacterium]